jgi:NAD(P)-dependent dehydrogenase (short-subunit alcohol dehydrogenase family)
VTLLDGRRILVTGGAGGIGRAVCRAAAAEGAAVLVLDMDAAGGRAVADDVGGALLELDLGDVAAGSGALAQRVGPIDGLVNAAGVSSVAPSSGVTREEWQRVLAVDLAAPFFLVQELAALIQAPGGAIVNVTSVESFTVIGSGGSSTPAYAAAKAGLKLVTECLASDLGPRGIRVNAVAPGFVRTPMTARQLEEARDWIEASVPLARLGEPDEIADAVVFLLSDRSRYVTGATLVVDGGLTLGYVNRASV